METEKIHKHIFGHHVFVTLWISFSKILLMHCRGWEIHTRLGKILWKYYINHTHIFSTFRDHSKLKLLKVAKTKFASHYTFVETFAWLQRTTCHHCYLSKWKDFVKNADAAKEAKAADTIKKDDFWDEVKNICENHKASISIDKILWWRGTKDGRSVWKDE